MVDYMGYPYNSFGPPPPVEGTGGITTANQQSESFFSNLANQIGGDLVGGAVTAITGNPLYGAAAGWTAGQVMEYWKQPGGPEYVAPTAPQQPAAGSAPSCSCSGKPSVPKPTCQQQAQKQMREVLEKCQKAEQMKNMGCVPPPKKKPTAAQKKAAEAKKKKSAAAKKKKTGTKKKKTTANKPKGIMATCFRSS